MYGSSIERTMSMNIQIEKNAERIITPSGWCLDPNRVSPSLSSK